MYGQRDVLFYQYYVDKKGTSPVSLAEQHAAQPNLGANLDILA